MRSISDGLKDAIVLMLGGQRVQVDVSTFQNDIRYDGDLKEYFGNLVLVGIHYDKDAKGKNAKGHSCVIERL